MGYIDMQLLASAVMSKIQLWIFDKKLHEIGFWALAYTIDEKMKKYLLIAFILIFSPNALYVQAASTAITNEINETFTKQVDITGDGITDKISLNIKSKNINLPIVWTLTISSKGEIIYSYRSDDTWLDKFFHDNGYVEGCNDYLSCKKKYYFQDLVDSLILTGNKWYDVNGVLDRSQSNTLYPLGKKQLMECCKIAGPQAEAILGKIEKKLREGKAIVLNILESPVHSKPPLIYIPEIEKFIRFYEE